MSDLQERVDQFCRMELPGQPRMMHIGTSYLVTDLWREVESQAARVAELEDAFRIARENAKQNCKLRAENEQGRNREAVLVSNLRSLEAENDRITHELNDAYARVAELERLLRRYREETPLGHQPHMIAHEVDAALAGKQPQEGE